MTIVTIKERIMMIEGV